LRGRRAEWRRRGGAPTAAAAPQAASCSSPDSLPDEIDGHVLVEAAGPPGVLLTVSFARGESDESLDVAAPIVVEGVLTVIRHPARGKFPAVVELQVRETRRVRGS
jgi:hypothetical protein